MEAFNGHLWEAGMSYSAECLAHQVAGVGESSAADHERSGRVLGPLEDDTAEAPHEFGDLAEKLMGLAPRHVERVVWYIYGFCEGIEQAQR